MHHHLFDLYILSSIQACPPLYLLSSSCTYRYEEKHDYWTSVSNQNGRIRRAVDDLFFAYVYNPVRHPLLDPDHYFFYTQSNGVMIPRRRR